MAHKLILRKDYFGHFGISVELNPLSQPHFYIIFLRSKAQPAFCRFWEAFPWWLGNVMRQYNALGLNLGIGVTTVRFPFALFDLCFS